MASQRRNWGDEEDDSYLPPTSVTGPDADGIKTVVEYKFDEAHRKVKVVKKFKVVQEVTRTSEAMRTRRQLVKFGDATGKPVGVVDRDYTMREFLFFGSHVRLGPSVQGGAPALSSCQL